MQYHETGQTLNEAHMAFNERRGLQLMKGRPSRTSVKVSGELTEGPYPENKGPGALKKATGFKEGERSLRWDGKAGTPLRTGSVFFQMLVVPCKEPFLVTPYNPLHSMK
ncbi:hypothetical protein E3N88_34828 [Mikania micrantha]|uniref:Uncharacterized protein n=1 Tax=Mikania micrantha TaxID=192012 RepID=A0A5N6LZE2_9ASTR|nr:hypothetical protein E3N88_34828 [Mikania micrantha]